MGKRIKLNFGDVEMYAELFETRIAQEFYANLPYKVDLTNWGNEVYGDIGVDLGEESPVPDIPPGGLAYTDRGNLLCIFFGQTPAWDVEYIGQIEGDMWKRLISNYSQHVVVTSDE